MVKIFAIKGRLNRWQFFRGNLFVFGVFLVFFMIAVWLQQTGIGKSIESERSIVLPLVMLWSIVAGIFLSVRRLHDIAVPGWVALLELIPGLGAFMLLFLLLVPGTKGDNKYGPGAQTTSTK